MAASAAKASASPSATQSQPREPDEFVPSEVPNGSASKPGVVWSSDDPEPAPAESESKSAPTSESPAENQSDEGKPHGRRQESGGAGQRNPRRERNDRKNDRGDRSNRNNKFKNKGGQGGPPNNKKKGKGRWQDKKRRAREEESPIEFGELLEFQVLKNFEAVLQLAIEIGSGEGDALDFNRI